MPALRTTCESCFRTFFHFGKSSERKLCIRCRKLEEKKRLKRIDEDYWRWISSLSKEEKEILRSGVHSYDEIDL